MVLLTMVDKGDTVEVYEYTLLNSNAGVVRDPDVSADGKKVLYSYKKSTTDDFHIYEMDIATKEEKRCFELLISVSGVGPKAALAILSVTSPSGFQLAVASGDEKALTAAPGVGKKLAQRVLLELRDF